MEALVAWFLKAYRERSLHPLLRIGSFVVVFLRRASAASPVTSNPHEFPGPTPSWVAVVLSG